MLRVSPIPFVGKIGFAYTFIDDFFMIGLNRSTIKHIIDGAQGSDSAKEKLVAKTPFTQSERSLQCFSMAYQYESKTQGTL
jgi:hypothetical protein